MIQISQIRLKPDSPETALHQAVYKALRLSPKDTCRIEIAKQSIDSRHKPDILYIYSVHVSDILLNGKKPVDEAAWIKKLKNRDITPVTKKGYTFPARIHDREWHVSWWHRQSSTAPEHKYR